MVLLIHLNWHSNKHIFNVLKCNSMKVADRRVYKTISWHITDEDEFRDDTYYVTCQEGDVEDIWTIDNDEDGEVDVNSWLGKKLIAMCEKYEEDDMGVVFGGE